MYRTIMVPLDGSKLAEQALPLATSIAKRAHATLRLAQVHRPGPPPGGVEYQMAVRNGERTYLEAVSYTNKVATGLLSDALLLEGAVVPALTKEFAYKNPMAVPKIEKISLNVGMGEATQNSKLIDGAMNDLIDAKLRSTGGHAAEVGAASGFGL